MLGRKKQGNDGIVEIHIIGLEAVKRTTIKDSPVERQKKHVAPTRVYLFASRPVISYILIRCRKGSQKGTKRIKKNSARRAIAMNDV